MIELKDFIDELKKNKEFAAGFDREYEKLRIGYLLKQARKKAGMTQEKMAKKMNTYKGNISRIENHAEDMNLAPLRSAIRNDGILE